MRLIDADALRENMKFVCMGVMSGTEPYAAPLTEIDNAPTIEERKTGKWVICDDGYVRCSKCNTKAPWLTDKMAWMSDFCPHCGASMV